MKSALVVVTVVCLQTVVVLALSSNTCDRDCSCSEEGDQGSWSTKEEGLATAVGAIGPLVLGGAGLALYKVLRAGGSVASQAADGTSSADNLPSSRLTGKRGSWDPSYKESSSPYPGARRGSTPLSLLGEDDLISFDESLKSPRGRPDMVNRWM